eukprot:1159268-Pelagomonas_calceolata.AAC.12
MGPALLPVGRDEGPQASCKAARIEPTLPPLGKNEGPATHLTTARANQEPEGYMWPLEAS